jgi:hypothetical protein
LLEDTFVESDKDFGGNAEEYVNQVVVMFSLTSAGR